MRTLLGTPKNVLTRAQIYSQWFSGTPRELCPQGTTSEILVDKSLIFFLVQMEQVEVGDTEQLALTWNLKGKSIYPWSPFQNILSTYMVHVPLQYLFILRK